MGSMSRIVSRGQLSMLGDALLFTSAAYGLLLGLSSVLIAPEGTPRPGTEWLAAVSSVLSLLLGVAVPWLVWVAHGHRLSWVAAFGALLGAFCTGFVVVAFAVGSALLGLVIAPLVNLEFAGPVAMLTAVAVAYLIAVICLVADAIGDLRARSAEHRLIDMGRLLALAAIVVVASGTVWWVLTHAGGEGWELLVFALVAGIGGALAVLGALVLTAVTSDQRSQQRGPAARSPAPTQ